MRRGWIVLAGALAGCGDAGGGEGADTEQVTLTTGGATTPTSGEDPTGTSEGTETETGGDEATAAIERYCQFQFSCGCQPIAWVDVEGCIAALSYGVSGQKMFAAMDGQTFDPACYAKGFDHQVDVIGCKTEAEVAALPEASSCPRCTYAYGTLAEGEACVIEGMINVFGSPCAQGLECIDGACRDRCAVKAAGEACTASPGPNYACDEGLYCDENGSGTCASPPIEGEACSGICAAGLVCEGTCVPLPGDGEACTGSCAAGLVCDVDGCGPPPGEGEACVQETCATGLYCAGATCAAKLAIGEACAADDACAAGGSCVEGTCAMDLPHMCDMN